MNIYINPLIPRGYYWVKVLDVRAEDCEAIRPRLYIRLQIGPMHEAVAGLTLNSIIQPSDAAKYYFINFLAAFRVAGLQYEQAIGRWASVEVYPAEYEGKEFSAVKYTYQAGLLKLHAIWIERAEASGRLTQSSLEQASLWDGENG